MTASQFELRWGFMGHGAIAWCMAKDLQLDPATRDITDVKHKIVAIASHLGISPAEEFIHRIKAPEAKAYGSYEELARDPNVDVVYVSSPHSHHYPHVLLALRSGKHVLCEKPFTVNAAQAAHLQRVAKQYNRFLMEAVWTRFFPVSIKMRELIADGEIGELRRVFAELSQDFDPYNIDPKHRIVNPDLAGGALLDLGAYPLKWIFQTVYHTLPPSSRQSPTVLGSSMQKLGNGVDVDEHVSMMLSFPRDTGSVIAVANASIGMHACTAGPAFKLEGTKGEITVPWPPFRPTEFTVHKLGEAPKKYEFEIPSGGGLVQDLEKKTFDAPNGGMGLFWEADEVARCIHDGKLQSETIPWSETVEVLKVMDEVRRQGGLRYPDAVEFVEEEGRE
ncbi:hypothetical protein YB2330_006526 [Saitoella coloradoensis]